MMKIQVSFFLFAVEILANLKQQPLLSLVRPTRLSKISAIIVTTVQGTTVNV